MQFLKRILIVRIICTWQGGLYSFSISWPKKKNPPHCLINFRTRCSLIMYKFMLKCQLLQTKPSLRTMTKLSNQAWTLCMSPNSNQSIRPRKWMSKMKVWGYEFIFAMPDENPARWWMNILEWVDLDPIFFGGWALPLISLSLYFYSFKLWCMGARFLLQFSFVYL